MRILHIDKFLHAPDAAGGGVGRYVRTLSEELRRRGHDVAGFGCAETGPEDRPAFVDYNVSSGAMHFFRMLYNPSAAALLQKHLRGHPADVAHLHNIYHHLTASILPVLASRRVGVVMTVHDYRQIGREKLFWRWGMGDPTGGREDDFYCRARRRCTGPGGLALRLRGLVERTFRWYARYVDTFLCPTHFMCDEVRRTGVPRNKILYSPVPLRSDETPSAEDDGNTLLFAGRLCVEKSPGGMLDLAGRLPDSRVVLAGEGPLRGDLERRCRRENLSNVEFLGHIPREDMQRQFARATTVIVTSRCMENSPVAMLEAMAAERCVVVPDQPPLREWITDGRTGRVYPTGDAAKLARVVKELLEKESARRIMGVEAAKHVRVQHDLTTSTDRIEQAYEGAKQRCALR